MVSSKIPGRIQTLTVEEGDEVKAGQLIAVIESDDLAGRAQSGRGHRGKRQVEAERSRRDGAPEPRRDVKRDRQRRGAGEGGAGDAGPGQANLEHQQADTSRTVALAKQGIMSAQARDEAVTSLQAAKAAVNTAKGNLAAAQASLRQAQAHELLDRGFGAHRGLKPATQRPMRARWPSRREWRRATRRSWRRSTARWMCGPRARAKWCPPARPSSPSWT